jgi:hypothetical protein
MIQRLIAILEIRQAYVIRRVYLTLPMVMSVVPIRLSRQDARKLGWINRSSCFFASSATSAQTLLAKVPQSRAAYEIAASTDVRPGGVREIGHELEKMSGGIAGSWLST